MRTTAIGLLLLTAGALVAQEPKPPELTAEEQKLAAEAFKLTEEGVQLYRQGKPAEAVPRMRQSLEIRQKLYPESRCPDGHPALALSLNAMGFVLQAAGSAEKALPFYEQALAMRRKLYPNSKYPDGHAELAASLNNMGFVLQAAGSAEKALPFNEQALAMRRKLYPESKYPDGHPDLARSLNAMGFVLQLAGSSEKALPFYEQALAMNHRLYPASRYPNGHPDLALSFINMGEVLSAAGSAEKAVPFLEQALAMRRKLYAESKYPDGHPALSRSLNAMGFVLRATGSAEKALPFYEQALAMRRKLYPTSNYPKGHPELAASLNAMGFVLQSVGSPEKALPFYEQALAMNRKLYPASNYPDGHPVVARSLNNMGAVVQAAGSAEKALPIFAEALVMYGTLGRRLLLTSSEDGALAYVQALPLTRDGYLSAALQLPGTAAAAYRAVWQSKAAVSRVLDLRHAAARASGPALAEALTRLKENRRRTEHILQDSRHKPEDRDKELARLADERDAIERQLAKDLSILARWSEQDRRTPEDMAKALPAGAAFVDVLAWTRFEFDPKVKRKSGEIQIPSYLAFVVAPGRELRRLDLGPAEPINTAVRSWRQAIERGEASGAPDQLSTLVWEKIAKQLPPGTRTMYLSPDGDLARLPWAALPIGRGHVLLENYALSTVPHGQFLLEQLEHPPKYAGPQALLTLGDVAYNSTTWPALPGTRVEIGALAALAPSAPVSLTKAAATAARLSEALPKARFAHLATHGEFQAESFAAERKRALAARKNWQEGMRDVRRVAVKNPLGYVGLVLAGGEVMSGLSILDLNLENVKLVTLSACETGLGEYTAAKGVENLQEAFHLAGCPNVVASLWKVNDAATAALMTQFYHEMWVNKREPLAALREAQLTIYRHPDRIPELAGERGRPALDAAAKLGSAAKKDDRQKTTPTRLWAAFVLSGVGK